MLKKDLARNVAESLEMKIKDVEAVIDNTVETITIAVSEGEAVQVAGLGKFERVVAKGREGIINFGEKAGETYKTEDRLAPKFKASKSFKDLVASK